MLTDKQAREIAANWHGGQTSALYALASTGAIDERTRWEIGNEIWGQQGTCDDLKALDDYAAHHQPRGPVDGWSQIRF